jgi:hypothetical protein
MRACAVSKRIGFMFGLSTLPSARAPRAYLMMK